MLNGSERSLSTNSACLPGIGTDAPHQRVVHERQCAACRAPASMPVPRSPSAAELEPGMPWSRSRQSELLANPPAARMTPRRARTLSGPDGVETMAPMTRPKPSRTSSVSGEFNSSSAP